MVCGKAALVWEQDVSDVSAQNVTDPQHQSSVEGPGDVGHRVIWGLLIHPGNPMSCSFRLSRKRILLAK